MDTADAFDSGWRHGHKCGYMDAVSETWLFMKDIPTTDPRYAALVDLADFLRDRRDRVLSHADETDRVEEGQ